MQSKSFKRKNTKGKNKNKNKKAMKTKKAMKKRHSKRNTRGRKMRTNIRKMKGAGGYTEEELKKFKDEYIKCTLSREILHTDKETSKTEIINPNTTLYGYIINVNEENGNIMYNAYFFYNDKLFGLRLVYCNNKEECLKNKTLTEGSIWIIDTIEKVSIEKVLPKSELFKKILAEQIQKDKIEAEAEAEAVALAKTQLPIPKLEELKVGMKIGFTSIDSHIENILQENLKGEGVSSTIITDLLNLKDSMYIGVIQKIDKTSINISFRFSSKMQIHNIKSQPEIRYIIFYLNMIYNGNFNIDTISIKKLYRPDNGFLEEQIKNQFLLNQKIGKTINIKIKNQVIIGRINKGIKQDYNYHTNHQKLNKSTFDIKEITDEILLTEGKIENAKAIDNNFFLFTINITLRATHIQNYNLTETFLVCKNNKCIDENQTDLSDLSFYEIIESSDIAPAPLSSSASPASSASPVSSVSSVPPDSTSNSSNINSLEEGIYISFKTDSEGIIQGIISTILQGQYHTDTIKKIQKSITNDTNLIGIIQKINNTTFTIFFYYDKIIYNGEFEKSKLRDVTKIKIDTDTSSITSSIIEQIQNQILLNDSKGKNIKFKIQNEDTIKKIHKKITKDTVLVGKILKFTAKPNNVLEFQIDFNYIVNEYKKIGGIQYFRFCKGKDNKCHDITSELSMYEIDGFPRGEVATIAPVATVATVAPVTPVATTPVATVTPVTSFKDAIKRFQKK